MKKNNLQNIQTQDPNSNLLKANKKTELLKQKIITNAQINHNIQQYQIQQLNDKEEQLKRSINIALSQLTQEIQRITGQYQVFAEELNRNLDGGQQESDKLVDYKRYFKGTSPFIISVQKLKNYLNIEKRMLKELVEVFESGQNIEITSSVENTRIKLHKMAKAKKLELSLASVHQKQLEREIRYLEEDILGLSSVHPKNNRKHQIIYIPDEYMTEKEEEQLNSKIQMLIEELERLIQLEAICPEQEAFSGDSKQKESQNCIRVLNRQSIRLSKMQKAITEDLEGIQKVNQYIQNFDNFLTEIPGFSLRYTSLKNTKTRKQLQTNPHRKIEEKEELESIKKILDFQVGEIIGSRKCLEEEMSEQIKSLKNRAKKLGI